MNTAKAEIVNQPVVRLTIELSNTHAAELAGLLAHHVDWEDFPWAKSIYYALRRVDIRCAAVFRDEELGRFVSPCGSRTKRMAAEERVVLGRP